MAQRRKFTVRYGQDSGNDLVATFIADESIRQNLERILPMAIAKGILREDCTPDQVRLVHNGVVLNSQLPLEEQTEALEEFETLLLEDATPIVPCRIRYQPDHSEIQSETVDINPYLPLERQLKDFFGSIRPQHRFRGFHRKHFKLFVGSKKLDLKKSLSSFGIRERCDVRLKARALLGWPPRFLEYFLTILIVTIVVAILWPRQSDPIEIFHVKMKSDIACFIAMNDTVLAIKNDGGQINVKMNPGIHEIWIKPREFPKYLDTIDLRKVVDVPDSVLKNLEVKKRWNSVSTAVEVKIFGYFENARPEDRIWNEVLVNDFSYPIDTSGPGTGTVSMKVPKGLSASDLYDVKFALSDSLLDHVQKPDQVYYTDFSFGFSKYDSNDPVRLVFYYHRPKEVAGEL